MRSRVVTTTAAGTSTWPIQPNELNSQAAYIADADPVAMATQVGGDDTEMTGERGEYLRPVQLGRACHPVDEHERMRAARSGALPYPGDSAARQLDQAGDRSRSLGRVG
jgi:hypothetical protein